MNSYTYNELEIGSTESFCAEITQDLVQKFCEITGDTNPLHTEREFALKRQFSDKVVYGMLTSSFLSTLAGVFLPGKYSLIHSVESKFLSPVYVGNTLTIKGSVTEKNDTFKLLTIKVVIFNEMNVKVCKALMKVGVMDE